MAKIMRKPMKKTAKRPPAKKALKKAVGKKKNPPKTKLVSGSVSWLGLCVHDQAKAAEFYAKVLGHKHYKSPMPPSDMVMLQAGGQDLAHIAPVEPGGTPRWMIFFHVDDVDQVAELCVRHGGKIEAPPMDIPPGRFAVLRDSTGAEFALFKAR